MLRWPDELDIRLMDVRHIAWIAKHGEPHAPLAVWLDFVEALDIAPREIAEPILFELLSHDLVSVRQAAISAISWVPDGDMRTTLERMTGERCGFGWLAQDAQDLLDWDGEV